jgi:hypothetical protein
MPTIFREVVRVSANGITLTFNSDSTTQCDIMDGWGNTPSVDSIIVPNGGAAGAVSGGPWLDKEKYMTLGGAVVRPSRAASLTFANDMRAMFRPGSTLRIERDTPIGTLFTDARVYDIVTIDETVDEGFRWVVPVVALDPYKYSGVALTGQAGVFAGAPYFRAYTGDSFNGNFDIDISGWSSLSGAVINWASGQNATGSGGAMQINRSATTGDATAIVNTPLTVAQPVVPGQVVQARGSFKTALTPRTCRVDIRWYDSGGNLVSTFAGATAADTTSAWTSIVSQATVPASVAFAAPAPVIIAAASGELHYVDDLGMDPFRVYNGSNARIYQQAIVGGAFPEAVSMVNAGNEVSKRVTITLVGPLTSGDYVINNETTDETMLPLVTLDAGRIMVIDCYNKSATVDGVDVTTSIKGEWITLAPGTNSIRLLGGVANPTAFMTVDALSAWR